MIVSTRAFRRTSYCAVVAVMLSSCGGLVEDVYERTAEQTRLANLATDSMVFSDAQKLPHASIPFNPVDGPQIQGFSSPLHVTQNNSFTLTLYVAEQHDDVESVVIHLEDADNALVVPVTVNAGSNSITVLGTIQADADVLNSRFRGHISLADKLGTTGWPMPFGIHPVSVDISSPMTITRLMGNNWETELTAYSPTGALFANSGRDILDPAAPSWPVVRMWNTSTHQRILHLEPTAVVTAIAFSSNEDWLALGHSNGLLQLWSTTDGAPGLVLQQAPSSPVGDDVSIAPAIQSLVCLPDESIVLSGSWAHNVTAWSLETGEKVWSHDVSDRVNAMALSPDNKLLAIGVGRLTHGGRLIVRRTGDWAEHTALPFVDFPREVTSVAFSHDGKWLAAGGGLGWTGVWAVDTGKALPRGDTVANDGLFSHPQANDAISGLVFAPSNSTNLVTTTRNGRILLWSMEEAGVSRWQQVDRFINDMTYSTDLERLAFATSDGAVLEIHVSDLDVTPTTIPSRKTGE